MFLLKWKGVDEADLVSASQANIKCPQVGLFSSEAIECENGSVYRSFIICVLNLLIHPPEGTRIASSWIKTCFVLQVVIKFYEERLTWAPPGGNR